MKILVVGATSAIASAVETIYAKRKAEFFLVGRNKEKLIQLQNNLKDQGASSVNFYVMDALDKPVHKIMLERATHKLGKIDLALIAHGSLPDQEKCEENTEYAIKEFHTNATSVIAILTLIATQFKQQSSGTIAVISSVAGDRGRSSNYLYGSAKSAITSFCEGLRGKLYPYGIHVVTIKPGLIRTPMTAHRNNSKLLSVTPQDIAPSIVKGIDKKADTIYTPGYWSVIMLIIRHLPESIFKRLGL